MSLTNVVFVQTNIVQSVTLPIYLSAIYAFHPNIGTPLIVLALALLERIPLLQTALYVMCLAQYAQAHLRHAQSVNPLTIFSITPAY